MGRAQNQVRIRGLQYYSSCLWHLQQKQELLKLSLQLKQKYQFHPVTLVVRGNQLSSRFLHEDAIQMFKQAYQLQPMNPYFITLIAHEQCKLNLFQAASSNYHLALKLNRNDYIAFFGLGSLLLMQNKLKESRNQLKKAISINSYSHTLYGNLGINYFQDNQIDKAMQMFQKAIQLSEGCKILWNFYKGKLLRKKGLVEEAIKHLETIPINWRDAQNSGVFKELGFCYKAKGNAIEAMNNFQIVVQMNKNDFESKRQIREIMIMNQRKSKESLVDIEI